MDYLPGASRKELSPANILILAQWDSCWISNLERGEINLLFSAIKFATEQKHICMSCLLPHNKPPENQWLKQQ